MSEKFEEQNTETGDSNQDARQNVEHIPPESNEFQKSAEETISQKLSKSINGVDFGYAKKIGKKTPNLILAKLNDTYDGNENSEGLVAKNEQIQLLLSELMGEFGSYIKSDHGKLKKKLSEQQEQGNLGEHGEKQIQMVESYNEYLLVNETAEGFQQFLTSSECINIISAYLKNHIGKNGKINFISKNDLKAKIKAAWKEKLYRNYISDKQGVQYEEISKLNTMGSTVKNRIDKVIFDYLENKGDKKGDTNLVTGLSDLLETMRNNYDTEGVEQKYSEDKINLMLRTSIREYSRLLNLSDKNRKLQHTNDAVFDLQLRSYLFLYGKIFYPNEFQSNKGLKDSENQLGELLEAILVVDGNLTKLRKNKFLEKEELLRREQEERDRAMRINAWNKMISEIREDNNNSPNNDIESTSLDIKNASGVEIVREKELGEGLGDFKLKENFSEIDQQFIQKIALEKTGKQFVLENEWLSKYINGAELMKFFIVGNGGVAFNESSWETFYKNRIENHKDSESKRSEIEEELKHVKDSLLSFQRKYNSNIDNIYTDFYDKKNDIHEIVKEYALGAVIDNIKEMFGNIINSNNSGKFMSGFEFDKRDSAKIENNCLIISGDFNGQKLSLKYDLKSGKLFINAFVDNRDDTIVVGSQDPNHEIGYLSTFEEIIDDFYNNPTNTMGDNIFTKFANASPQPGNKSPRPRQSKREMREKMQEEHRSKIQMICGTKLDEIGGNIKNEVESKSTQYTLVSNLFKTLGIFSDNQQGFDRTINLTGGSLYRIVQLITNPKNTAEDLNSFAEYMKILMSYIGLDWGRNKDHQDKTKDISRIIFNDENKQNHICYLRENTQNFDNEHSAIQGKSQFDEKSKFGILKIIEEKFTDDKNAYPNWKLSTSNIERFKNEFEGEISEIKSLASLATELNKAYNNYLA